MQDYFSFARKEWALEKGGSREGRTRGTVCGSAWLSCAVSDSACVCPRLRQLVLESLDSDRGLTGPLCVGEERNHERHQNVEGGANRGQL